METSDTAHWSVTVEVCSAAAAHNGPASLPYPETTSPPYPRSKLFTVFGLETIVCLQEIQEAGRKFSRQDPNMVLAIIN